MVQMAQAARHNLLAPTRAAGCRLKCAHLPPCYVTPQRFLLALPLPAITSLHPDPAQAVADFRKEVLAPWFASYAQSHGKTIDQVGAQGAAILQRTGVVKKIIWIWLGPRE